MVDSAQNKFVPCRCLWYSTRLETNSSAAGEVLLLRGDTALNAHVYTLNNINE